MSPISTGDSRISINKFNSIDDLFFVNENEEESFEKDAVNSVVIEKVKARILKGLNLKEPPKSHLPIPPLQKIVPNTCFHKNGPQCLRFQIQIPKHLSNANNSSAELWLYKKDKVTEYTLTQIIDDPHHTDLQKRFFSVINQTESEGWTRIDISALINGSSDVLDIEVYSSSKDIPLEFGNDKNPLLIISSSSEENNSRSKRAAVDCEGESSSCCRMKFYVSFEDIGWDSWIVQPEGYFPNACKGSCMNRLDLTVKHHTHVLLRLISKEGTNHSEIAETINCSPKTYKPLSIIYVDNKGLKVISNLPDMSVSECACS
ncbi:inhibin beta C chain [Caerostris extrusa]|uniref:Inhibin beta C chain n=1 Tax=Caerostris extrusa TaxID=172846 RepID=A0AAV4REB0_CAEEX|nr:inhibin beta C chain [Caerostris extrusa]